MSEIKGRVGKWSLNWKSVPRGSTGTAHLEIKEGSVMEVRWRRDHHGIWIELPHGTFGFDLEGNDEGDGRLLYSVSQRESGARWSDLAFLRAGDESAASAAGAAKKGVRVRAQMPGKIIRVMTQAGAQVEKDQPLAVMEAMKMENEIRAPQAGRVSKAHASEGQAVETGADLFVIEPV